MDIKIVLCSLVSAATAYVVLQACGGRSSASADAPPSVQSSTQICDKSFPGGMNTNINYAEQAYPGLTREQIAGHVTVWDVVTSSAAAQIPPTGYDRTLDTRVYVRDGFIGVNCLADASVIFVYAP